MFLWYLAFLPCIAEASKPGICAMNGCNCTVKAHRWINVKCVFSKEQVNARAHARLRIIAPDDQRAIGRRSCLLLPAVIDEEFLTLRDELYSGQRARHCVSLYL